MGLDEKRTIKVHIDKGDTKAAPQPEANAADTDYVQSRGIRFPLTSDILEPRFRRALRRRNFQRTEADALRPQVKPEDTVLNIGGGIGFLSSVMAQGCKAAHVTSYEPHPALAAYMREVHRFNAITNVTVEEAAIGTRKGKATFYQRQNTLSSSLDDDRETDANPVVESCEVEVHNINTVWKYLKANVLVCDVVGGGAAILEKAKLPGIRLAVISLHPKWLGEDGTRRIFDAMHRNGLAYFPRGSQGRVVTFKKDW